jgi:hypothetical protein
MSKTITSVDNLTDPGQPLQHGDRYRNNYSDDTYKEDIYQQFASNTPLKISLPIRVIATKSFYRRMTQVERTTLRGTADENINDLRDDLQRSPTTDLDDPELLTMLQATPLSAGRITALLADGTEEEKFVNVATGN